RAGDVQLGDVDVGVTDRAGVVPIVRGPCDLGAVPVGADARLIVVIVAHTSRTVVGETAHRIGRDHLGHDDLGLVRAPRTLIQERVVRRLDGHEAPVLIHPFGGTPEVARV